jgi:hypothetical protein
MQVKHFILAGWLSLGAPVLVHAAHQNNVVLSTAKEHSIVKDFAAALAAPQPTISLAKAANFDQLLHNINLLKSQPTASSEELLALDSIKTKPQVYLPRSNGLSKLNCLFELIW